MTARISAAAASAADSASCATVATSASPSAFHKPSLASTRRPPAGGTGTRVHSGLHITAGALRSPMARDTASPPGYVRMGPTSSPPWRMRPRRAPASTSRLASNGSSGLWSRVSLLKSGMSGAVAASSSIDLRISAVKRGERLGWPTMGALKCTSSDPESPALAATTPTLGSPPASGRRRCTHTTEAVVPPSRALPPRPPPPLDAGMQASRDGKHDPALAYERSTRSNALAHADSSGDPAASAPHRSSSFNTARSQWDDAVAFTCPSNTAKHDRKSPDLAASKSSASSSSAAPDAPAARAPRLALARLALGGRSPVSQNTSGTATNLSSPFRAYI